MKAKTVNSKQSTALKSTPQIKLFIMLFVYCLLQCPAFTYSQGVGINLTGTSAAPSAMLDVSSVDKGVLISRMSTAQRDAISSPAQSLLIYNITTQCFEFYENNNWNTMGCTCTIPDIPVATAGSGATAIQITANWNAATGATSYSLDVSTVSDFSSFVAGYNDLNVGAVTTYDIAGLTCNTTYYYRIKAINSCGTTGCSNTITINTTSCIVLCAQLQRVFGGTLNDEPCSAYQTSDGGYVIGGYTSSYGAGGNDTYILKTDENGTMSWNKFFRIATTSEVTYCMTLTSDGGYVLAGQKSEASESNFYLVKVDGSGTLLWTKKIGGATANEVAFSIHETSDGGLVIAGYTNSFGAGSYDFYVVKTDSNGNFLWNKTYGGTGQDMAYSIKETSDGGFIIAGYTTSYGVGFQNILVIKTDGSGNLSWSKTYGGAVAEYVSCVLETSDGGYIIVGTTETFGSGGNGDIYLVKTDASGTLSWTKTYGSTGSDQTLFNDGAIQQTTDGGYILVGRTNSYGAGNYDVFLIKTDGSGNLSWSKTYGGAFYDDGKSVQQTSDGGYIIVAFTQSFGAGNKDIYLIKTDENGNAAGCNTSSPTPSVSSGGSVTSPTPTVTTPSVTPSSTSPTTNTPSPTISTPCSNC